MNTALVTRKRVVVRSLVEAESVGALIEPTSRIVETLRLAVLDVGMDKFLSRTGSSPSLLEKWINGEKWVPLDVVKEACEINRSREDAPSYSKILSECTAGAQFRITAREEVEKPAAAVAGALPPSRAEIPTGRLESSATTARLEPSHQIAKVAIALFIVPLLGAAAGFLAAGAVGAVTGTITSFAIVTALAFLFLALISKKKRGT
jgi:hypothetical protein